MEKLFNRLYNKEANSFYEILKNNLKQQKSKNNEKISFLNHHIKNQISKIITTIEKIVLSKKHNYRKHLFFKF